MKKVLIIYPHWPPSNLAGVHRPRLIGNFLPQFDWEPTLLTIKEQYYEEPPDNDLIKTVAPHIKIVKVNAFPVITIFGRRIIGDIGIRGLLHLYKAAQTIVKNNNIDFIWIPIPSWYVALLGRRLYKQTGVPYGIDYIDPWISQLAPHEKKFSRAWWSNQIAHILEPIALKTARLITGVSTAYYQPALDRNFKNRPIEHVSMPYGFDPGDHQIDIDDVRYPWDDTPNVIPFVYAGAFLPQSYLFIQALFSSIRKLRHEGQLPPNVKFYFLGTGYYSGDSISDYAKKEKIPDLVVEIRMRFPFLHIQHFLRQAAGILIIGSTEKHYTASKTFQCLLSQRPVWAIFHQESSAAKIMKECQADQYLNEYYEDMTNIDLHDTIYHTFSAYLNQDKGWSPNLTPLEYYSAKESARALVNGMNKAIKLDKQCNPKTT